MQLEQDMMPDLDDNRRAGPSSMPEQTTRGVSRTNKAIAAISGAAVTSLMMTPFDVIKTRLQTQGSHEPLFQPSSSSPPGATCCQPLTIAEKNGYLCQHDPRVDIKAMSPTSNSNLDRTSQLKEAESNHMSSNRSRIIRLSPHLSSSSGSSTITCDFPDRDVAARELESVRNSSRVAGLWDGVVKVGRNEGMRGLWRGLTPTLLMTVPSQVTYMTCYDSFRQYFLSLDKTPRSSSTSPSLSNFSTHTLFASLASGALARSISATLVTPLELLRTRLQASTSNSASRNLSAILVELGGQVKAEGPKVLFRGLVPTLYRDVPFSAIYFAGYETSKRFLTGAGLGERNVEDGRVKEFGVAFLSGSSSGILAAIVTQPFDLIKTRLQADAAHRKKQSSTLEIWKQIAARDGTSGLFRGLTPRVAKVAPACGIMIASFEFIGRWLEENTEVKRLKSA
ncbi:hypothetical protein CBS101457_000735 [Exobasidium rhododendri]|nr:hypothetical protein CBS101457_000735 [Exobasidium rhododendri]